MGIHVIKIPDIGEGIAEVELVAWHVQPGDEVTEDQALADVMTDKATVEIPSPVAGKVLALGGEIGGLMAVGSELIRIEVEGAGRSEAVRTTSVAPQPAPAQAAVPPTQPSPEGGRSDTGSAPKVTTSETGPASAVTPSPSGGGRGWGQAAPVPPSQPSPKGGRSKHQKAPAQTLH